MRLYWCGAASAVSYGLFIQLLEGGRGIGKSLSDVEFAIRGGIGSALPPQSSTLFVQPTRKAVNVSVALI
jgi:hypothetical protein